ncbi:histidinol-phosphate transaminase [Brucella oryzae]|uniref:histidinol-phosphate transaminase n=1 Tax=Brucella oryzae TaxID=335286 RepID=UPI001B8127B8|nr:histidinol-phosphate transaminase [Brucella oryzae]MBR7653378.1 histidinol-phosphate transaminase [Brucella oryzae]
MSGYVPGTQAGPDTIKLNTNENPFPPSPAVMAALAEITPRALQRYPDPMANGFRDAVAQLHNLPRDQIIATNGGDELLRLAVTTFVEPGRAIGVVTPGYGVYSVLAEIHRAPLSQVHLDESWGLAPDTAARWNADGAQLALITNPHAPSGKLFALPALEQLAITFQGVLLIDEAYVDFVDPDLNYDATSLLARHSNVLLLRTLSKGYALAGLRLAYGLGSEILIKPMLEKTKDSYNVDAIAQALGVRALQDRAYAAASWDHVRQERERLTLKMRAMGFMVEPSQTNFLLVSPPINSEWDEAPKLQNTLESRNIYLRWFNEERLREQLRITIGTCEENDTLIQTLHSLRR